MFKQKLSEFIEDKTFKQYLELHPYQMLIALSGSGSKIQNHPLIKRGIGLIKRQTKNYTLNFLTWVFIIKMATIFTHTKRSIALSAPRNNYSIIFKYIFMPMILAKVFMRSELKKYLNQDFIPLAKQDPSIQQAFLRLKAQSRIHQ